MRNKTTLPIAPKMVSSNYAIYSMFLISYDLLSISKLTADNNVIVSFDKHGYNIKDNHTNHLLLQGPCVRKLYKLLTNISSSVSSAAFSAFASNANIWHQCLGHPHSQIASLISFQNHFLNIPENTSLCNACVAAKGHKLMFRISTNHQYKPL